MDLQQKDKTIKTKKDSIVDYINLSLWILIILISMYVVKIYKTHIVLGYELALLIPIFGIIMVYRASNFSKKYQHQ